MEKLAIVRDQPVGRFEYRVDGFLCLPVEEVTTVDYYKIVGPVRPFKVRVAHYFGGVYVVRLVPLRNKHNQRTSVSGIFLSKDCPHDPHSLFQDEEYP